jgi:hypothetical protein
MRLAGAAAARNGIWERRLNPSVGLYTTKGKIMPNAVSIFHAPQNLSMQERAISVIAGLGLAAAGAKPRPNPILNVAALLGGAYLTIRGATGRCPIKQALQSRSMAMLPADEKVPAKRSRVGGR